VRLLTVAVVAAALGVVLAPSPARAAALPLPVPAAGQAQDTTLCQVVGCTPDRLLRSVVPGPVRNDEQVLISLNGSGAPAQVGLEQRLRLTGKGDYQVRERGPARSARSLSELDPPITKFGAVVWQGFSPGSRELAARLVLDPLLEAPRLPLGVTTTFTPRGGRPGPLSPGGGIPGAGTVTVRLTDTTAQPAVLPTATDALDGELARLLGPLLARARAAPGGRLPAAGAGLPASVQVTGPARAAGTRSVPLRVTGSLRLSGAGGTVSGPGTRPLPGGAAVAGTLSGGGTVELQASVDGPAALALDLTAVPVLDPRLLQPPGGARSWQAWAAGRPGRPARVAALGLLVDAAATGARASSYSPYLGADLPGSGSTVFRFSFAAAPTAATRSAPLRPRPGPLALAGLAALLLAGNAALLWRRS